MEVATQVFLNNGLRSPQRPEPTLIGDFEEEGLVKKELRKYA